jgi:Mce-associated membrane protein
MVKSVNPQTKARKPAPQPAEEPQPDPQSDTAPATPSEPVTAEPVTAVPVTAVPVTAVPVTAVPVTAVPVTAVPVTPEPVTAEPVTAEIASAEASSAGSGHAGPEPAEVSSAGGGSAEAQVAAAVSAEAGPAGTGSGEAVSAEAGPAGTGSGEAVSAEAVSAEAGPAGTGSGEAGSAEAVSAEAGPAGTGSAEPASAEAEPAETGTGGSEAGSRRRALVLAVIGVATVLAGAFGIWAAIAGHSLRSAAASANSALVDQAATRAVKADVTRTVQTIFSYNYADTARTKAAAQRLLTGQAIRQYDQLFALVQREAPKEKLVVTTKVSDIGVELLTGDRARLLVFANQQDSRAGTSQTSYSGAMFAVTAVRAGARWKIESIDTFTSPAG